jgi:hypothetical protein
MASLVPWTPAMLAGRVAPSMPEIPAPMSPPWTP